MCHKNDCPARVARVAQEIHPKVGASPAEPVYMVKDFFICGGDLHHDKYPKRTGVELRNMFNAYDFECITEKTKWVTQANHLIVPFFEAQLILHRVEAVRHLSFGKLGRICSAELRQMLESAVENGEVRIQSSDFYHNPPLQRLWLTPSYQCDTTSDIPSDIEKRWFADYQTMKEQWEVEYAEWAEKKAKADKVTTWRSAQTAQERADIDIEAMIRKHFCKKKLTCPDRSISPEPIVLATFSGDLEALVKAVQEVPGLKHVQATHWAGDVERTVHVLGWSKTQARRLAKSTAKDLQETFWVEQWARIKADDGHDELVGRAMENDGRHQHLQARLPKLSSCKGVFAMHAPSIRKEFPWHNVLHLHVSHFEGHVALAACDFGIYNGTMILATDSKHLTEFHDVDEGDISMSSPGPRHHPHPPSASSSPMNAAMKRRHSSAFAAQSSIDRASLITANRDGEFPLYFMFRGRDTRNDRIEFEPREGKIFFSDRHLHTFRGSIDFGLPLQTITFDGFRLSGLPERAPRWDSFSSEAYENEERQREELDED